MACDFALPPRIKLDHASAASADNSSESRGAPSANTGKKGQPWTEAEHLGFLAGLKKLGKGNWRGISRLFVPSRTPTQVASHAQKHFLRLSGVTKRRSRFSTLDQAAGAQSILEAAAHANRATQSGQDWASTYPPGVASRQTDFNPAEAQQLPTGSCPEFTWRAMPSYLGVGRGTVISQTEQSEPFHFTKICRPTAYRASTRNGDVQKLVRLVAAAAAVAPQCHASTGRLQQSSHSAFRVLKPQQSVRA